MATKLRATILTVVALASLLFVAICFVGPASAAARSLAVARGLDYFHARQQTTGAITNTETNPWAILGITAAHERVGAGAWQRSGKNPYTTLNSVNHVSYAEQTSNNAPMYYSRAILAYVAAGQANRVATAGSRSVNLLQQLYGWQSIRGSFSARGKTTPDPGSIRTTCWAILAMRAYGVSPTDADLQKAGKWLHGESAPGGGFAIEPNAKANALDTALAIQALRAAGYKNSDPSDPIVAGAREYLLKQQNSAGGFPRTRTDGAATAAAIQAIYALGERPSDKDWLESGHSAPAALVGLQYASGAFTRVKGKVVEPVATTGWALMALNGRTLYSVGISAPLTPLAFRPRVKSLSPANKAKFTKTNDVRILAGYYDPSPGTGVYAPATRILVDGRDRTKAAVRDSDSVRLNVNNLTNGSHSYKLRVVDRAGNRYEVTRTFTIALPVKPVARSTTSPSPTPSSSTRSPFTPIPSTPSSSSDETTPIDPLDTLPPDTSSSTTTPLPPVTTTSPVTPPQTGMLINSPSPSPSPSLAAAAGRRGSVGGYLASILLAMIPIGAVAAYLLHRRRIDKLADARPQPASAVRPRLDGVAPGKGAE